MVYFDKVLIDLVSGKLNFQIFHDNESIAQVSYEKVKRMTILAACQ